MSPQRLADLPAREIMPKFHGRMIHSERMTFAYWHIEAGAELPEHAHPHEQVVNMLAGEFQLIIDGETIDLHPEEVFVIPGNVPHAGRALTDCRILDVFCPVREDYR